jgi:hypothetical protein
MTINFVLTEGLSLIRVLYLLNTWVDENDAPRGWMDPALQF